MRWLVVLAACSGNAPIARPSDPPRPPIAKPAPEARPPIAAAPATKIPTITTACDDVHQIVPELVADFDHPGKYERPGMVAHPLLCWGDDCVWTGEPLRRPKPHPVAIEYERDGKPFGKAPVTIVNREGRVCTDDRCDKLGPKLRAAIADLDEVSATTDHEAIAIRDQVWSRTKDAPIAMPPAAQAEFDVSTVVVLGNWIAYGRSCNEYCSETARIIDSRGKLTGNGTFDLTTPGGQIPLPIDLAGDRFVLFSAFGDATLIERGKPVSSTHVGAEDSVAGGPPVMARIIALPLDATSIALEVCTPIGCQLGTLDVHEWDDPSTNKPTSHLGYHVQRQLPRCSVEPPSY